MPPFHTPSKPASALATRPTSATPSQPVQTRVSVGHQTRQPHSSHPSHPGHAHLTGIPDNGSMGLPTALSPLTERNFRLLWTGQAVSAIGDSLTPVALAFAALMVGHSATALGIVFAVSILGRVIALPMGGVWADRLPRQLVMLTSDWVRAAVPAAIGLLLASGHAQLWELVLQALLYNFAAGFFQPASGALVPQTVTVQKLQQANALMGLSKSLTQVGGPAVSGILVALVGPGWVFVIDAITFVASALSLALLKIP